MHSFSTELFTISSSGYAPSFKLVDRCSRDQAASVLTGLRGGALRVFGVLRSMRALRLLRVMVRVERLYTVFTVSSTLTSSILP